MQFTIQEKQSGMGVLNPVIVQHLMIVNYQNDFLTKINAEKYRNIHGNYNKTFIANFKQ
jgi:hypothetical protein